MIEQLLDNFDRFECAYLQLSLAPGGRGRAEIWGIHFEHYNPDFRVVLGRRAHFPDFWVCFRSCIHSRVNMGIWAHKNRPHCFLLSSSIVYSSIVLKTVPIVLKPSLVFSNRPYCLSNRPYCSQIPSIVFQNIPLLRLDESSNILKNSFGVCRHGK